MKRNLLIAIAVATLMIASTIAQAADVTFSGQFRPRYEVATNAQDTTNADKFFNTRVRLNAKANVNANTEVFLQLQSTGQWGTNGPDTGTRVQIGGSGAAFEASDTLADVGLHQAYVVMKNFSGRSVDVKLGRQEIVVDGHRLFGHTGWTPGAATQDAIRLTHSAGNHTIGYFYMENLNNGSKTDQNDSDIATHAFYGNVQGVLGGNLSGYFVYTDDENANTVASDGITEDQNQWYTIGARQAGKLQGIDYRVEYYHQFGDASVPAGDMNAGINANYTALTDSCDCVDRDAHMFGIRLGKTFSNAKGAPTLTLWYDRLSGTDDDDVTGNDYGGFDTLFDTGHKFYGFMDAYLSRSLLGTAGMGLEDIAVKFKMSPAAGWTAKADMHWFSTTVDMDGDNGTLVAANTLLNDATTQSNNLGAELDLTLAHKYDANTKISLGYSHYWTTNTFALFNGFGTAGVNSNADADWFYVMMDTKF